MSIDLDTARQEFMTSVLKFLKDELGIEDVEYDPDKFQINSGNWFFFLGNAFQEFTACDSEDAKKDVFERYLRNVRFGGEEDYVFEDVRDRLFPSVRDRQLIENTEVDFSERKSVEELKSLPQEFPRTIVGEHYIALVAIDNENSISYVNKSVIEEWQVSFDKLMDIAMANLRKISSDSFIEIADGVFASGWQDTFDTSRILLTDKVKEECNVQGQHLAFLASRDHVFITGSDDVAGIKMVLEICTELESSPRPLYMVPLVLVANEWQVFEAPEFHPCHHELKYAKVIALSAIYQESQNTLNSKLTDDVFVASFTALQSKDSSDIYTTCVWTCKSLLPRTEWIDFMKVDILTDKTTSLGMARWEEVEKSLGDKFSTALAYPPRVLVDDFDPDKLSSLNLVEEFPVSNATPSPAPLMVRSYNEVLLLARERFISAYHQVIEEFKDKPGCGAEIIVEQTELEAPSVFKTKRIDFLIARDEQYHAVVIEGRCVPVVPQEYETASGMTLILKPVSWTCVEFVCDKFDSNAPQFVEWCNHWMDLNESFTKDKYGLSGALHSISIPTSDDNSTAFAFEVDFGSAPIEAFESMIEVLCEMGVGTVMVRTPWTSFL